jgi:hypothetical protein
VIYRGGGGENREMKDEVTVEEIRGDVEFQLLIEEARKILQHGNRGWRFDTTGGDAIDVAIIVGTQHYRTNLPADYAKESIDQVAQRLVSSPAWNFPDTMWTIIRRIYKTKWGHDREWPRNRGTELRIEMMAALPETLDYARWAQQTLSEKINDGSLLNHRRLITYESLWSGLRKLADLHTPAEDVVAAVARVYEAAKEQSAKMEGKSLGELISMTCEKKQGE